VVAYTRFPDRVLVKMVSGQCQADFCRPSVDQGRAAATIARTDRST
jgi:hypothetical protein